MIQNGWFREENELWPGQAFALEVEKVLYEKHTEFQQVLVFRSRSFGNVFVLDDVIQATERDEFAYQEMISHLPLLSHKHPKRILIVGGGDGGCAREVLKHPQVESVDLVEIDASVIELARRFLPEMSKSLDDKRLTIHITDGFEFLKQNKNKYDVIISDTSDPEGPAERLFGKDYFTLLHEALTADGLVSLMASESVWLRLENLASLQKTCLEVFAHAKCAFTMVPTYTSGQLALMVCSKAGSPCVPVREYNGEPLRYYTPAIHEASFVLPTFAQRYLE